MSIERSFTIGDKWLYYKIYSGPDTADLILSQIIKPITEIMLKEEFIDCWFFIRYVDPKEHLRVRFHVTDIKHIGSVINLCNQPLKDFVKKDLIWKIQIDTYHRELERYGSNTIQEAETIFFYDSVMICSLIDMIEGEEGEELRWLFGLKAIDSLLDSFSYNEYQKLQLLNNLKIGFRNEFGVSKLLNSQLKDKYRKYKKRINDFMIFKMPNNQENLPLLDILNEKQQKTYLIAQTIQCKKLEKSLDDFLASYIHMLMNRLFKSKNRIHEMVCYDFLHRYYMSVTARKKVKIDQKIFIL